MNPRYLDANGRFDETRVPCEHREGADPRSVVFATKDCYWCWLASGDVPSFPADAVVLPVRAVCIDCLRPVVRGPRCHTCAARQREREHDLAAYGVRRMILPSARPR